MKDKTNAGYILVSRSISFAKVSPKAKGIYLTLLMLPPGWDLNIPGLCLILGTGRKSVQRGLDELKKAGFLSIEQYHKTNGQIGYKYTVKNDIPP